MFNQNYSVAPGYQALPMRLVWGDSDAVSPLSIPGTIAAEVLIGLGRIVALHYRPSTSYQIR
jgi:hypothetical protein